MKTEAILMIMNGIENKLATKRELCEAYKKIKGKEKEFKSLDADIKLATKTIEHLQKKLIMPNFQMDEEVLNYILQVGEKYKKYGEF